MLFKVIDRQSGQEVDALTVAAEMDRDGRLGNVSPRKNGWILEDDGCLAISDACGNFQYVDAKRFEAVPK